MSAQLTNENFLKIKKEQTKSKKTGAKLMEYHY